MVISSLSLFNGDATRQIALTTGVDVVRCGPQRVSTGLLRWLCAAAVVVIALWLTFGHGVAMASPVDPSGSAQGNDTSSEAVDPDPSDPADEDGDTPARPTVDPGKSEDADEATESDDTTDTTDTATDTTADTTNTTADPAPTAAAGEPGTGVRGDIAGTPASVVDSAAEPRKSSKSATDDAAADTQPTVSARRAVAVAETSDSETSSVVPDAAAAIASVVPEPEVVSTRLIAPVAPTVPSLRSLVSARPITANSIVTDLLTWVGLRPLAGGIPVPATPVSGLVETLWLAVRQTQYTLNNQRPTAEQTTSGPGPDGVITGSLNAVDFDDTTLAYNVTTGPEHGKVVIDALGDFTYTPGASGHADSFSVTIDDTAGNPFHVHGLLGLLGLTRATEVTITIAATTPIGPASIGLGDLAARDGVEFTTDSRGAVGVIDGRFTDRVVTTADDAAAVFNALAPALGAAAGFADPSTITVAHTGVGSSVENFYRFNETVGGIKVLGSQVILVTNADGAVTSLFNNYVGLAENFDVTPDSSLDTDAEIRAIAGSAYLGSAADREVLGSLLTQGTFTEQLVVYAIDENQAPTLMWRVVLQLPDTGDMTNPGATYLIRADGPDAGDVIMTASNVRDLSVTTTAADWRGEQRTINVTSTTVWFSKSYSMVDGIRNIKTYKTAYPYWGLLGPSLPGTLVKRSWYVWDKGAVSAHANTAVAYDYYLNVLGRESFDNDGGTVEVSIRYRPAGSIVGYANAFWDPSLQQFAYGDSGNFQAAVDVVGHEYTHAVVSYVVGDGGSVWESNEPGALNEAYADILGVLIEGKSGADRWLIAEDTDSGPIRNIADPSSISGSLGGYRAHYSNLYTGDGDDGGVHINSTIFSNAAYRMMTDPATSGVSDETWAKIFYGSLGRLSAGAKFADGRVAVLSAAATQGFTPAELAVVQGAIRNAFDAVGIGGAAPSSTIAA